LIEKCKSTPENYVHDGEKYICPDCQDGFFVNPETGDCEECIIDFNESNCVSCSDYETCSTCKEGFILNPDQSDCVAPIDHCIQDPLTYEIDQWGDFICDECQDNFVWDGLFCTECSEVIEGCSMCDGYECH